MKAKSLVLSNRQTAWHFEWGGGRLRTAQFENRLTGLAYALSGAQELGLVFSAAPDRLAEPHLRRDGFAVRSVRASGSRAVFELRASGLEVSLHVRLDGPTREKWAEVRNASKKDLLLLDVELDDFTCQGTTAGGGEGQPIFIEDEIFAAVGHPCGVNQQSKGRVQLGHYPGRRLRAGETWRTRTALVSVAPEAGAQQHFVDWLQARAVRKSRAVSIYTPFGINNQWGGCPTLDDEQNLNVLDQLARWKRKGVTFDYYTLDTGWVDFNSDLKRFRPVAFPEGPDRVIRRVKELGMKFGLWFATGWGAQSCWDYGPAFADGKPGTLPFREGYPNMTEGVWFCWGEERYQRILKEAVLHHVRHNGVRLLKFDGGVYRCDQEGHGHLPGKYSAEPMFDALIDIAESARKIAPDLFVIWYWGLKSPFWALHGDMIFESGLHMEGSATSEYPSLYYRDSVTLALDQNTRFARNVPPVVKDSLGVWLSDIRWGNFMAKERWREALVMDLGRGSLLFPNLWSNLFHLDDDDVKFLGWAGALAKKNAALFSHRRNILGDAGRNEVYGYAHGRGARGFLFLNNMHFTARRAVLELGPGLGLDGKPGTAVRIQAHFPDREQLRRPDGAAYRLGDVLELWLRPFEILMLEISPGGRGSVRAPYRAVSRVQAAALGAEVGLRPVPPDPSMEVRFTDAAELEQKKLIKKSYAFEGILPPTGGEQPLILSVVVRLRKGDAEWRYAPKAVVQIVQALARIGGQNVLMIPVPDGRQHGNTQSFGCSWVAYKTRLSSAWSQKPLKIAIHANVPEDVEARVEAWVVRRWWHENTRPVGDGYYAYAPS